MNNAINSVLVVDDEPDMLAWMEELLVSSGLSVTLALDLEVAKAALSREQFPVIVADLRLKGQTAFDLLQYTKSLPDRPRFIFMSAYGTVEDAVKSFKCGGADFLTKPFEEAHLLDSISAAIKDYYHEKNQAPLPEREKPFSLREKLESFEVSMLKEALDDNGWIQSKAAIMLGIEPSHLHYKMSKYSLSKSRT